jgi:hypothetical protein
MPGVHGGLIFPVPDSVGSILVLTRFLTREPIDLGVIYPIELADFIWVLLVNLRPAAKLAILRTERQFSARWRREDWSQALNQSVIVMRDFA